MKLRKDEGSEPVNSTEYRSIVGALRYLTHTRPDISFAVGIVSRFMEKPQLKHLQVVKVILRYIKGTMDFGIKYSKEKKETTLLGYTDSDHGNDLNDGRSTSGMAATLATFQGVWLQRMITGITSQKVPPVEMKVDNKSSLDLMKNPVFHGRSKHIDIHFHFICECVENGEIKVSHVCSNEQKADILTKPPGRVKFEEM